MKEKEQTKKSERKGEDGKRRIGKCKLDGKKGTANKQEERGGLDKKERKKRRKRDEKQEQ